MHVGDTLQEAQSHRFQNSFEYSHKIFIIDILRQTKNFRARSDAIYIAKFNYSVGDHFSSEFCENKLINAEKLESEVHFRSGSKL